MHSTRSSACPILACAVSLLICTANAVGDDAVLLEDDFNGLRSGMFSRVLGAHTEYHHIPEAAPRGNWAISCFGTGIGPQRAWRIWREDGDAVRKSSARMEL